MESQGRVTLSMYIYGLIFLLVLLLLPLEVMLGENLRYLEISFIKQLQENTNTEKANLILPMIGMLSLPTSLWYILPLIYHVINPRTGLKVALLSCFVNYIYGLLKLIYEEPRPYWVDQNIKSVSCYKGFGSPSLELGICFSCYIYLSAHIYNRTLRIILLTLSLLYIILLNFIDLYCGNMFLHQIIISLCYGFFSLIGAKSLDGQINRFVYKGGIDYYRNKKYIIYNFILTIGLLVISIIVHNQANTQPKVKWINNARMQCELNYDLGTSYTLFATSFIFLLLGMFTGSMNTHKLYGEYWWDTQCWKRAIRGLMVISISFSLHWSFNFLPSDDTTTRYVLINAFPVFISGYINTGVLPYLCEFINLINKSERLSVQIKMEELPIIPIPEQVFRFTPPNQVIMFGQGTDSERCIFHGQTLTEFEDKKLKRLEEAIQKGQLKGFNVPADWTRNDLMRFVYGSKWKTRNAVNNLKIHLQWRQQSNIENLFTAYHEVKHLLEIGFLYFCGRDKFFRPILVQVLPKIDLKQNGEEFYQRGTIFLLNYLMKYQLVPGKVENWVIITDMESQGISKMPKAAIGRVLKMLQQNYRCRLAQNFIVNAPKSITFIYGLLKPFLDPKVCAKTHIEKANTHPLLQSLVNPSQLQQKYGGQAPNLTQWWPPAWLGDEFHNPSEDPEMYLSPRVERVQELQEATDNSDEEIRQQQMRDYERSLRRERRRKRREKRKRQEEEEMQRQILEEKLNQYEIQQEPEEENTLEVQKTVKKKKNKRKRLHIEEHPQEITFEPQVEEQEELNITNQTEKIDIEKTSNSTGCMGSCILI